MSLFLALIEWFHWLLFFLVAASGGAIVGAMFTHWTHRTERKREE